MTGKEKLHPETYDLAQRLTLSSTRMQAYQRRRGLIEWSNHGVPAYSYRFDVTNAGVPGTYYRLPVPTVQDIGELTTHPFLQ